MGFYVSIDIETTGKDPARNAILSIGACAMRIEGCEVDEVGDFYVNMRIPSGKGWDADTKVWWGEQSPEVRKVLDVAPIYSPGAGIEALLTWMHGGLGRGLEPVNMVFYPASFDYRFLTHYVSEFSADFTKNDLHDFWFKHRETMVLDLQTMAMTLMKAEGNQARRNNWPSEWRVGEEGKVLHNALDDARIQMSYFLAMREWARKYVASGADGQGLSKFAARFHRGEK